MPFYNSLRGVAGLPESLSEEKQAQLVNWTIELVTQLRRELSLADFWSNPNKQGFLRNWIIQFLDGNNETGQEIVPFACQAAAADRLIELAKANRHRLGAE